MRQLRSGLFLTVLLLAAVLAVPGAEKSKGGKQPVAIDRTTGSPVATWMNINNISTVLRNNGTADIDLSQTNSGLVFPKGSSKTAIFQSGLLWAAMIAGDPQVRVGGSAYTSGLQPGKLLGPNQSEDPNLPKNRIYRVRRGYEKADLTSEIRDEGNSAETIRAQYKLDWDEWPVADGAPFTDVDSNGVYDPTVDIPGVPGADMTVWFVANDNNTTNVANLYGANPLGVECQVTVWGYAQEGPLGNMIFKSYLLINKSTSVFDSMYVCQWSDPDLGNATDDYAGSDTSLSLGYIYNALNTDATYNPLPPPAAGFDFFQGPRVPSPGDSAIFRGKVLHGYRSLPMTAFFYFINSDPTLADPTRADPAGSTQFYNFMRGRIGLTGQFFQDPQGNPTTFTLTGDPRTGEGWVDGEQFPAGDRRIGLASGPFTMAPGDTQEIVVAEICAGAMPGVDRLSAVDLLKFYDRAAQLAYDNFFNLPSPPVSPRVAATELDREIVLEWGTDLQTVNTTESASFRGFTFQGYNVYQLPSASARKDEGKKIAVFDIADGVTRIATEVFDPLGGLTSQVVQHGTDSGIKRHLSITGDALNGGSPLINGIRYYFAVTAYSYNPDPNAVPNNLENPLAVITVVPHAPNPGTQLPSGYGDTLAVAHSAGASDGGAVARVVNPTALTGASYKVVFGTLDGEPVWHLIRTSGTRVDTVARNQTDQSGSDASAIVIDGIELRVTGPPNDFKNFLVVANAGGALNPPEAGAFAFNDSEFPLGPPLAEDTDRPDGTRQQSTGLTASQGWGIHTGMNDPDMDYHYEFFLGRVTQGGARWPLIIPNDFEIRFTAAGSRAWNAYTNETPLNVPFELWNIGSNTPGDVSDDYRLFPYILDIDGNGQWNLTTKAGTDSVDNGAGGPTHGISGGSNDPFTDWIYWVVPKDHTPGQAGYNAIAAQIDAGTHTYLDPVTTDEIEVLRRMVLVGWNLGDVTAGVYPQQQPETGTVFRIISTKPNTTADEFTMTAPTVTQSVAQAKADVERINVFPNPYYGVNTEELNKYQRFVTFSHLPQRANIRIFNLAGVQVRQIQKNSTSQFERWDLANDSGLPVGSGLYIVHITMPDLGGQIKILKLAIVQEQQILDRF